MEKTTSKTHSDERIKPQDDAPKVVGLGYFSDLRGLTNVDTSNSYVVFLNQRDPEHIRQLIKFTDAISRFDKAKKTKRDKVLQLRQTKSEE